MKIAVAGFAKPHREKTGKEKTPAIGPGPAGLVSGSTQNTLPPACDNGVTFFLRAHYRFSQSEPRPGSKNESPAAYIGALDDSVRVRGIGGYGAV